MAKRKGKRKRRGATPPKKKQDDGFGTLAAKLSGLEVATKKASQPPPPPPEPQKRKLTEAELMEEAFAAAGASFERADKYTGRGYAADDVELVGAAREVVAEPEPRDGMTAEDALFFEQMAADVERLESKRAALADKAWAGMAWRTKAQLAALTPRDLESLHMTPAHRDLLRRSRGSAMEVLYLRHVRLDAAIGQLEAFVRDCVRRGVGFGRVVHGKGEMSAGAPVLKPAVVEWCEGAGAPWVRAWAPEIDRTGKFGSVVLWFSTSRG